MSHLPIFVVGSTLRFRPSLKRALDELAAADRRPLATYIELVLEDHIERSSKPAGKRK